MIGASVLLAQDQQRMMKRIREGWKRHFLAQGLQVTTEYIEQHNTWRHRLLQFLGWYPMRDGAQEALRELQHS